jgi:hypothetical protein
MDQNASPPCPSTTGPTNPTVVRLTVEPNLEEIFRSLGYPRGTPPSPAIAEQTERIVAQGLHHLQPRGTYSLHAVTARAPDWLALGELTLHGRVGEFLRQVDRIAAFVVTVGRQISQLAEAACRAGDALSGWMFDAFGSWAAEATADALMRSLRGQLRSDEMLSLRYSPGYCGMDMAQQRTIFQLAEPESIGVSLLPTLLMQPTKSISGMVGIGPEQAVAPDLSPCDACRQVGCHMHR